MTCLHRNLYLHQLIIIDSIVASPFSHLCSTFPCQPLLKEEDSHPIYNIEFLKRQNKGLQTKPATCNGDIPSDIRITLRISPFDVIYESCYHHNSLTLRNVYLSRKFSFLLSLRWSSHSLIDLACELSAVADQAEH